MRIVRGDKTPKALRKHPDIKEAFENWFYEVKKAKWESPEILKAQFPRASNLGNGRVVFRLRGGRFRLVALVDYRLSLVYVRFVGTHKEYERINAKEV